MNEHVIVYSKPGGCTVVYAWASGDETRCTAKEHAIVYSEPM